MRRWICLLLSALVLFSALPTARAEGTEEPEGEAEEPVYSVLREEEIAQVIEDYLTENNIWRPGIGIGFLYTATGEEWYYNGDKFFYSASLYKVPLLMLVSNMVARGELEQDAEIKGFKLTQMEEAILGALDAGAAGICLFSAGSMTPDHWAVLDRLIR